MIRRTTLIPIGAAVGAMALLVSSSAAFGAPVTYTITSGTTTTGTTAYTATTTGAGPQIKINNVTTGTAGSCQSGTANGVIKLGSNLPSTGLGTIAGTTWVGCQSGFLILSFAQIGTWKINGTAATTGAGVTKVSITNVKLAVTATGGGCDFTVTGGVKGTITTTPSKQQLKVNTAGSTLKVSGVSGCFGFFHNDDKANFAATYNLVAAKGKLVITSP